MKSSKSRAYSRQYSYIFNLAQRRTFSEVVREAHSLGFTEPDPRDDLSGVDVARKLIISRDGAQLRWMRFRLTAWLLKIYAARVLMSIANAGETRRNNYRLVELSARSGEVLRYVGAIDSNGNMSAQLRGYPLDHPFASLTGSDNIVSFQTARYNSQPMIVRGPRGTGGNSRRCVFRPAQACFIPGRTATTLALPITLNAFGQ